MSSPKNKCKHNFKVEINTDETCGFCVHDSTVGLYEGCDYDGSFEQIDFYCRKCINNEIVTCKFPRFMVTNAHEEIFRYEKYKRDFPEWKKGCGKVPVHETLSITWSEYDTSNYHCIDMNHRDIESVVEDFYFEWLPYDSSIAHVNTLNDDLVFHVLGIDSSERV
jgi:hypothetical protein